MGLARRPRAGPAATAATALTLLLAMLVLGARTDEPTPAAVELTDVAVALVGDVSTSRVPVPRADEALAPRPADRKRFAPATTPATVPATTAPPTIAAPTTAVPSTTAPPRPRPAPTVAPPPSAPSTTAPPPTEAAAPTPEPRPEPTPELAPAPAPVATLADRLPLDQSVQQVVTATRAGSSTAPGHVVLRAFERIDGAWRQVVPDTSAAIGYRGFAADRHEGDHTSPIGIFGLGPAFGSQPDPGTALGWRPITPGDCWSGAPDATYNTWIRAEPCGPNDEDLFAYGAGPYRYAAVIGFNTGPTVVGRGSAIFLHVATSGSTEGCVAVPEDVMVSLLRWLRPGAVIAMGPEAALGA